MNFITINELNHFIYEGLYQIPRDIDLVVGIPRSGLLVANIVALYLNLPLTDVDGFICNKILSAGSTRKVQSWIEYPHDAKKILVIDDSIASGKAMREVKDQLSKFSQNFIFCAAIVNKDNCKDVDIYFEECEYPRMFEWNLMHHDYLKNACVDIDGVLCQNPSVIENDDNINYQTFLLNAKPKFIPTKKIHMLVTCRLEKWRADTEKWLDRYHIKYDKLIMLDSISAIERKNGFNHGKYKGEIYKKSNSFLFIESDLAQAIEICKISNKQVFCIENQKFISPDNIAFMLSQNVDSQIIRFKRVIKSWIIYCLGTDRFLKLKSYLLKSRCKNECK